MCQEREDWDKRQGCVRRGKTGTRGKDVSGEGRLGQEARMCQEREDWDKRQGCVRRGKTDCTLELA